MLLTKIIKICINTNKVRQFYMDLGYLIPIDKNPIIEIDIKDLNKNSHKSVECKCSICDKINNTTFLSYNKSIIKHGYYSCPGKCSSSKIKKTCRYVYNDENYNNPNKNRDTCLKKYGVENVFQLDDIKNKIIETNLKKFNVENISQSEEIKVKKIKTCFNNYGVEHPIQSFKIKEKTKQTCLEKYGVENYTKTIEYKEKTKQTCLEKYGSIHPMKNIEINEKQHLTSFKKKYFKNTNLYYQGTYELDFLEKYFDIGIKKINSIKYKFDNKTNIYFPDFYYEPLNLIIEIKSDYTYEYDLNKNIEKQKSCIEQGYNFIFIKNKKYDEFDNILKNCKEYNLNVLNPV